MSTPAAALEDEDLLREILLRLPPLPSTLSRASLVCTRWRRILSDPRFLRSLSRKHPEPPLLGFFRGSRLKYPASTPIFDPPDPIPAERSFFVRFLDCFRGLPPVGFPIGSLISYPFFAPVLDPPHRIPAQRFFVPEFTEDWQLHACRHGLAVMLSESLCEVFVWDPLNGQQHRVPYPPELRDVKRESFCLCSATVMCVDDQAGHVHDDCFLSPSFKLVLICTSRNLKTSFACVYESASGVWGNIVSTSTTKMVRKQRPGILIGNTVYWLFHGREILAFDIERQTLRVIETPAETQTPADTQHIYSWSTQLLRINDDSVLGLAFKSKLGIHIWERKLNSDGVAGWVLLQKINQLEGISSSAFRYAQMMGYDEELNVVVLTTHSGDFMVHLQSMQIRLIFKPDNRADTIYFPYRNFNTAGRGVGWKWVDPDL